jgi:glycosyltransferase involved in cell wall biosynthesis
MSARAGGGQTYLRSVLAHDPPVAGTEILLLAPPSLRLGSLGRGIEVVPVAEKFTRPLGRTAWQRLALPGLLKDLAADVAFFPSGTIPRSVVGRCATVTMSRNMLPFDRVQRARFRPGYVRSRIALLEPMLLRSMQAADLVIFVSDHAREVIRRRSGDRLGRTVVIRHGVGREFAEAGTGDRPAFLPDDYLLYVSYIEPYKGQLELVRAFSILKQRRPGPEKLLLVGPLSSRPYSRRVQREIDRLGLGHDVVLTGDIPHEQLPAVNRHARVVVFPSACENCPNALLEGMAAGRPMVVSDRPPMPEMAGDTVRYADPSDSARMAEQLAAVLDDPELQVRLGQQAAARARRFDWSETAARTWTAIGEVCDPPSIPPVTSPEETGTPPAPSRAPD